MDEPSRPGWLERLSAFLMREPEDRDQLLDLLRGAYERNLMDAEALGMIEGVLQVSETEVRDIMIPRSQMDVIDINDPPEKFIPFLIHTAHSRFPVVDKSKDNVIGILLAKDMLRYYAEGEENFNVREMLRPAIFIPESKRLNTLLRDFRTSRNHIAMVVDEYGGVAGLVTIEDVMEQIVGDIADEYDYDEPEDSIIQDREGRYRVKATTLIEDFNTLLKSSLDDDECDTIGGLVVKHFGHLPKRGEGISFGGFSFQVLRADSRRIHSLIAARVNGDGPSV